MIKPVMLYQVHCDQCGCLFANEETPKRDNETHLYTTIERAIEGIQIVGWQVLHDIIYCPRCDPKTIKPESN